jgi:hypothetical protein
MQYLALLKLQPGTTREQLGPLMKLESAKAWEMMAADVLRSAHYIKGPVGAVLMRSQTSVRGARSLGLL